MFAYNLQIPAFDLPELNQQQAKVREPFTVLFDRMSRAELGPIPDRMATKSRVAIVYQVLYSDVSDHLAEYATLISKSLRQRAKLSDFNGDS